MIYLRVFRKKKRVNGKLVRPEAGKKYVNAERPLERAESDYDRSEGVNNACNARQDLEPGTKSQ
jgi:hypothetical protein